MTRETIISLSEGMELPAASGTPAPPWRAAGQRLIRITCALIDGQALGLALTGFLMGRVSILGELSPFGLAFFAAVTAVCWPRALVAGAGALLGVLTTGQPLDMMVYASNMLLYWCLARRAQQERPPYYALPLVMAGVILLVGATVTLVLQKSLYGLVLVIFQALFCLLLAYIFLYALPAVWRDGSRSLSHEACIALAVIVAAVVAGLHDWRLGAYGLTDIAAGLVVMVLTLAGGAGTGTMVGVVMGAAGGLMGAAMPQVVGAYAFGGMAAGVCRPLGKPGVILGYLLGTVIIMAYSTDGTGVVQATVQAALAGGCVLLWPRRYLTTLSRWLPAAAGEAEQRQNAATTAAVAEKVGDYAVLLRDLAGAVDAARQEENDVAGSTLTRQLAALVERVCQSCAHRPVCWEQNFYQTYHRMEEVVVATSLAGGDLPDTAAEKLRQFCSHHWEMAACISTAVASQRTCTLYSRQVADTRRAAAAQMQSLGLLLEEMAHALRHVCQSDREKEAYIMAQAAGAGCPLISVRVRTARGREKVQITMEPCRGTRPCTNVVLPLVSGVLQERLDLATACGHAAKRQSCRLQLTAAPRWEVMSGLAQCTKQGSTMSGDVASLLSLPHGQLAVLLGDGMGSGRQAARESTAAVRMLGRCLLAGFSLDTAVKTVNSLLQVGEENFAAVDLAVIDLYDGTAEFLKIGAAPSFIKRVREVGIINTPHVPLGILAQLEAHSTTFQLQSGDVVVMVSDGALEASRRGAGREEWLVNALRRLGDVPPQQAAERILAQAVERAGQARDDMTVVVLQMKKR